MSGRLSISLRAPDEVDWPRILELANFALGHVAEAPPQDEWLRHRMAFGGHQQHRVAEHGGEVVGYAAVERKSHEPEATFRIFVVTSWLEGLDVAEALYGWVAAELASQGAQRAWLREYASDQSLIDFVRSKGFEETEAYEHDGKRLVTLTKDLGNSNLAV